MATSTRDLSAITQTLISIIWHDCENRNRKLSNYSTTSQIIIKSPSENNSFNHTVESGGGKHPSWYVVVYGICNFIKCGKSDMSGWRNSSIIISYEPMIFKSKFIIEVIYFYTTAAPYHFYSNLLINNYLKRRYFFFKQKQSL